MLTNRTEFKSNAFVFDIIVECSISVNHQDGKNFATGAFRYAIYCIAVKNASGLANFSGCKNLKITYAVAPIQININRTISLDFADGKKYIIPMVIKSPIAVATKKNGIDNKANALKNSIGTFFIFAYANINGISTTNIIQEDCKVVSTVFIKKTL
jgi:hypothetical protein